jgi:hypothetical protein
MGSIARPLDGLVMAGTIGLWVGHMVADHQNPAGCKKRCLAIDERQGIDDMMDDIPGEGSVEGCKAVEGVIEHGDLVKLGLIFPSGAAVAGPVDHLSRQVHADDAAAGAQEGRGDQSRSASGIEN